MRLLLVHPSSLTYSEIFLRLEPLGRERAAGAAREAGHEVRLVDLQVLSRADLAAELAVVVACGKNEKLREELVGRGADRGACGCSAGPATCPD
jgi:hypothetical protein